MLNQLKTVVLLGLLSGVLLAVGWLLGGFNGLTIGLIFAIVMNFGSYWFSDKFVLMVYRAKKVSKKDYPELVSIVKEVAHLAQIPMPQVYIVPSEQSNAFATGRNPKHAVVACTEGIMKLLSKDELRGVIAHEMAHIKNRDILIQTIAATIAAVISYVGFIARWGAIFGGFGNRDRDGGNILQFLVLAIITPLIATIIRLAISRSREYLADETGAGFIKNPQALASALAKLHNSSHHNKMKLGSEATSSLFIINPFTSKNLFALLSTHPPMEERIKRLKHMKF
ncbi:zinc metalloprotease HtpX [Candidatus Woesearchaeota archaeon]|jgi:heat shock protein HtpX|nr:zinc metalloprotease HtpX [Candidatus Woesearchaeota archaeon]